MPEVETRTPTSAAAAVVQGCRAHGVSADDVEHYWNRAEEIDAEVGVCVCCTGPCPPSWASRCQRCDEVGA